jgi:Fic family protein
MRNFDYTDYPATLLTPETAGLLSAIHEFKGKQELFIRARKDVLDTLLEVAKIQSTKASNRIEGIFTSDDRLKRLVMEKAAPASRNEREIAGYRDVLATIHEAHDTIPVTPNVILQLHRNLYSFHASSFGGRWKDSDNIIAESGPGGETRVRFRPVPAFAAPDAMRDLCDAYRNALANTGHDPLLLSVMFIFDFLCIHPFNDGNGRMSRLLTLLLLYRQGYIVGKYISIEMLIEKTKDTYYEALQSSSDGWEANRNDLLPFIRYMLGVILKAYREFSERVEGFFASRQSKPDRIRSLFEKSIVPLSKAQIAAECPDISIATIEKTLKSLLDEGVLAKRGGGRSTSYYLL